MNTTDRVIIALDLGSEAEAVALVEQAGATASSYKVGLQSLTAEGPSIVRWLVGHSRPSAVKLLKLLSTATDEARLHVSALAIPPTF